MTREVHHIPPAPRQVRVRAFLWHWWPLAFVGFLLAVYGGAWTLMMFLAFQGKPIEDSKLDREGQICPGRMERLIQQPDRGLPGRAEYSFQLPSEPRRRGISFLPQGYRAQPGDSIRVEYLPDAVHVNRIQGGRLSLVPPLVDIFFWAILMPGLTSLLVWILGALRLRHLMVHGDIAVGDVMHVHEVPILLPRTLRVVYGFRDRHAKYHIQSHWVRARSALGQRVQASPAMVAVIHSRRGWHLSRLVIAEDFCHNTPHKQDEIPAKFQ